MTNFIRDIADIKLDSNKSFNRIIVRGEYAPVFYNRNNDVCPISWNSKIDSVVYSIEELYKLFDNIFYSAKEQFISANNCTHGYYQGLAGIWTTDNFIVVE